jgi:hypothetical protein
MRLALATLVLALTGCASSVYRLEGEALTPGGVAKTPCETEKWLVIAPTRAMITDETTKRSHPVTGLGLYRVGEDFPESIPGVEGLPHTESIQQKQDELSAYKRRQVIAASLGVASLAAIAAGTVLFVTAFGSKTVRDPVTGQTHEENPIDGTRAGLGGATVGLGFALGISGLVVNPSHAESTHVDASRYVFLDPPDDQKSVEALTEKHNAWVRSTCAK